jgi:hypothetical protein
MKKFIVHAVVVSIALFSANAFAEKIIIKGNPIVLEKQGELYVVPETYKVQDYQYVEINGVKRACFSDARPDFANLDVVTINIQMGANKSTWNCYAITDNYFVIQQ